MRLPSARVAIAVVALLTLGFLLAPSASAAVYSSTLGDYHFSYPDAWTSGPSPGSDAVYEGTVVGGYAPMVIADHDKENQAEDNSSWLLDYAWSAFNLTNSTLLNATVVQAPHTFTAASGRLSAEYVVDYNDSGTTVRLRQVLFVSAFLKNTAWLTFVDNASTYASHEANWTSMVDSFGFDGEPEIPADLSILIDGGTDTVVEPLASVRFMVNRTLPNGLVVEWFQNGTSVGISDTVDLSLPPGTAVISVHISNATATRTLSTTITAGNATAPPPPAPYGTSNLLPIILAIAVVAVAVVYLGFIRPKKKKPQTPSQGAPPADAPSPPGPPRNI